MRSRDKVHNEMAAAGALAQADRDVSFGKTATGAVFVNNTIRTSKYTILTFLPLNLWEQLHRAANVYFLFMSLLMAVGEYTPMFVSSVKAISTAGVLALMMFISAVMAAVDDRARHKADKEVNERKALKVDMASSSMQEVAWQNVSVGDLIVVKKNEEVPADLVVLGCSDATGRFFVETMNLDGETNLKGKAAVEKTHEEITKVAAGDVNSIFKGTWDGQVKAEPPSRSIYTFVGNITLAGTTYPLTGDQLMLRATVLRNTAWVVGVVVYTGKESRVVMNSRAAPLKMSTLEKATNRSMLVIVVLQVVMTLVCAILYVTNTGDLLQRWYLTSGEGETLWLPDPIAYFLTFLCLFSNFIPISMYSTMEIANLAQMIFVNRDQSMYDEGTGKFAKVRSMNLLQEIGMVSYVFSDKTGTLTQNVMELRQVSIDGTICGKPPSDSTEDGGKKGVRPPFSGVNEVAQARSAIGEAKVAKYLEILSVCHTVVAEKSASGEIKMEAESPDELALVQAAADMGWAFQHRTSESIQILADGAKKEYQVLGINAFTSARKRMSMLVKSSTGEYVLLVKGADDIMIKLAASVPDYLKGQLYQFACLGMRTLVIGRKVLPEKEAQEWVGKYREAQNAMQNRDEKLEELAAQAEQAIEIVGVTAVEDKLQDYVADTISRVKQGGVKVWVLTGDKLETAKNIGFSCAVLSNDMEIIEVTESSQMEEALKTARSVQGKKSVGLIITGGALEKVLEDLGGKLLELGELCSVVIACRVSPSQKGEVVKLVRYGVKPMPVTLAIGDGANDVAMIQEAHVGVGISGKEGTQAVNASDFAISQFSFLMMLLLVHGRWNYRRLSKFILYSFHKNIVQCLQLFTYTLLCAYSGTSLYEDWVRNSFNLILGFPVIFLGFFDRDMSRSESLQRPDGYAAGRLGKELNVLKMTIHLVQAIVMSIIISVVTLLAYPAFAVSNQADYYTWGTVCFVCLITAMLYRLAYMMTTWNIICVLAFVLTFIGLWFALFVCGILTTLMGGVVGQIATSPLNWVCLLVVPLSAMVLDLLAEAVEVFMNYKAGEITIDEAIGRSPKVQAATGKAIGKKVEPAVGMKEQFLQQELPSKQRLRNARSIIGGLACSSSLLLLFGLLLALSASVPVMQVQYAGPTEEGIVEDEFARVACEEGKNCIVTFTPKTTLKQPVYVMYKVDPLQMNMNNYIKSTSTSELKGVWITEDQAESACISALKEDGERLFPCGLKAASLFNDSFALSRQDSSQWSPIEIKEKGIAWASDLNWLKNPDEYPNERDTRWLYERFPNIADLKKEGVTNEHFAVWNRPAALANTLKLWGTIEEDLLAGEQLQLTVESNFPVAAWDGRKSFILTEKGTFGGRIADLGIILLVLGGLGLAGMIIVLVAMLMAPQKATLLPATGPLLPVTTVGAKDGDAPQVVVEDL
eukprot:TRINITY_DN8096_c0_g1_i1.p1 TRINITY_DN8096_c0_g1~~TRINITY_DN8096_c0_g1_i1.p1  ORF type:complete len:1431 (-),score=323.02 TRINITY_DN8096_c0_g1_i1:78-4370(-)